jgi:hypothetical protein
MNELGVDKCDSSNAGALFATKNNHSAYYAANDSAYTDGDNSLVRLICDASGTTPAWRFATDIEKDVAALSPELPKDTAVYGKINTNYVYVKEGNWRRGTELDTALRASCVLDNKGITDSMTVKLETSWFVCDVSDDSDFPTAWRQATTAEADTALFGTPGDGDPIVRLGNVNKSHIYVYEDVNGDGNAKWRYGTALDLDEDLGPCVAGKVNNVLQSSTGSWYKCVNDRNTRVEGVLVPTEWREATSFERDTVGFGIPTVATANWNSARTTVYVYDTTAKRWRIGSTLDTYASLGPCTEARKDTIRGRSSTDFYRCSPNYTADANVQPVSWIALSQAEYDTLGFGYCNKDYMRRSGTNNWFAEKGVRRVTDEKESDLIRFTSAYCLATVGNQSSVIVYYGTKPTATDGAAIQGRKNTSKYFTYDSIQGDWLPMTSEQYSLGLGGCTIARTNYTYGSSTSSSWYPKGMVSRKNTSSSYYLCKDDGGERKWVLASNARWATYGLSCNMSYPRSSYKGKNTNTASYTYVCEADTFRTMTASERWAVNNTRDGYQYARCGVTDEGEVVTVPVSSSTSKFVCKNKLYVWNKIQRFYGDGDIGTYGAYHAWDDAAVVIGTRMWTTSNLYADTIGSSAPYWLTPRDQYPAKKVGLYFTFTQAKTACSNISFGNTNFRLPSYSDYDALFEQYADKPQQLFSKDGWDVAGSDEFSLSLYPNGVGYVQTVENGYYGYIGYYTDKEKTNFVKVNFLMGMLTSGATYHTSHQDSVIKIRSNEIKPSYTYLKYAGVRCVIGDKENPPTKN